MVPSLSSSVDQHACTKDTKQLIRISWTSQPLLTVQSVLVQSDTQYKITFGEFRGISRFNQWTCFCYQCIKMHKNMLRINRKLPKANKRNQMLYGYVSGVHDSLVVIAMDYRPKCRGFKSPPEWVDICLKISVPPALLSKLSYNANTDWALSMARWGSEGEDW